MNTTIENLIGGEWAIEEAHGTPDAPENRWYVRLFRRGGLNQDAERRWGWGESITEAVADALAPDRDFTKAEIRELPSLEELLSSLTAPGVSTQEAPPILILMREEETWHLALPADRASFRMAECGQWREASSHDLHEAAAELAEARRQAQEDMLP